jgi:hypothetical protein
MAEDPSRRKEKIAAKVITDKSGQSSRGKATSRRGRGAASISIGRGFGAGPQILGKGGTQGKTIPIAVGSPTRLGEVDNSHVVHDRGHPKKRPPTKYDSSMTHQNYEGICVQVKKGREQNPYISPKLAAIDYRF